MTAVTENKYLRYQLTQTIGKDAADKFLETMAAAGSGGGLTDTAVKTANYTAVASDRVLCDASGGSFTVTLPASPTNGDKVGVFATAAPGANAVTISGTVIGAKHDSKLYIIGDYLEFCYSSAASGWLTIASDLTRHCARVTLSAAITTNTAATAKKITFNTEAFDIGACFDSVTDNRFVVKRPGRYHCHLQARSNSAIAVVKYYMSQVRLNGSSVSTARHLNESSAAVSNTHVAPNSSILLDLVAGDYLEGWFVAEDANMGAGNSTDDTFITVEEIS